MLNEIRNFKDSILETKINDTANDIIIKAKLETIKEINDQMDIKWNELLELVVAKRNCQNEINEIATSMKNTN